MLWYKAWRESRIRFAAGALLLAFLSWQFLANGWQHVAARQSVSYFDSSETIPYSKLVWHGVWSGRRAVFVMAVLLLGLGGLQRERGAGTAAYTLALPATRRQIVAARVGVGVLQLIALALVPALLVYVLSPIYAQQSYPAMQALQFALLYMAGGLLCFAVAFLCSTALDNEHTVVAACVVAPFGYTLLVDQFWRLASVAAAVPLPVAIRRFRSANLFDVMVANDMPHLDPGTFFITRVPWLTVLVLAAMSAVVFWYSTRIVDRADF
jgi:ABC-type transport system involved in multi-copper enzyme maturation permease subunit